MSTKKALIVDDSSTAQYRLKKMLRQYDLKIDVVDSGEDALRYLSHSTPDVVFMDHLMPGMDGLEALKIMKSHPETATVPVIMYTSKSGDVYTGQARALGALDVVSKDTINAADLGVVLKKLNVLANEDKNTTPAALTGMNSEEVSELKPEADNTEDNNISSTEIKRHAADKRRQAETRNVELRISHLEQTLEESRRFISARVVRELQSHRHKTKRDLTTMLNKSLQELNEKNKAAIVTPQELVAHLEESKQTDARPNYAIILVCVVAVLSVLFHTQTRSYLSQLTASQQAIRDEIAALPLGTAQPGLSANAASGDNLDVHSYFSQEEYLNDLTWAFNQSGRYTFRAEQFDADALVRLTEFFAILDRNSFKGVAIVKLSLGDYCVDINEFGQTQLAPDTITADKCTLLSEASSIEGIVNVYAQNIQNALSVFYSSNDGSRELTLKTLDRRGEYPSRTDVVTVQKWNAIASKQTFLEVELVPDLVLP